MKANLTSSLVVIAFGLAILPTAGLAENQPKTADPSPPIGAAANTATPAVPLAAPASPDLAIAQWSDIENFTFDMRDQFFTGLARLEAKVDAQIAKLTAKRATMTGTTHTQEWDFTMKEMESARSYLQSVGEELVQATAENWAQRKDKVGQAWVRTQDAYEKVKSSTTS